MEAGMAGKFPRHFLTTLFTAAAQVDAKEADVVDKIIEQLDRAKKI